MKHTQGKWTVGIYETTPNMLERMKHKQVAVCSDADPSNPKGLLIALCGDIDPEEPSNTQESLADAHLIAAAPEMFSALEAWENALKSEGMMVPYFLRDALKKARGEQ